MAVMGEFRRRVAGAAKPVAALCVLFYFGYHLVEGRYGLIARHRMVQRINVLETEAAALATRRATLERRVAHFRAAGIDPDLLDEMTRRVLGYAGAGDIVIAD